MISNVSCVLLALLGPEQVEGPAKKSRKTKQKQKAKSQHPW
jgi:hypothetical protein